MKTKFEHSLKKDKQNYMVQLHYGWNDTGFDYAFAFMLTDQTFDGDSVKQNLLKQMQCDGVDDLNLDITELQIPQTVVERIKADAITEYLAGNKPLDALKGEN